MEGDMNVKRVLSEVEFQLIALNSTLVNRWRIDFSDWGNFKFHHGDIFSFGSADAIVSPANSFGYMDGGIDAIYIDKFGEQLQTDLINKIKREKYGELIVGDSLLVEIPRFEHQSDPKFKYLISAPTMRHPMDVSSTKNAYLAFRAVLINIYEHNINYPHQKITKVICPGLAVGIGRMAEHRASRQMASAYYSITNPT